MGGDVGIRRCGQIVGSTRWVIMFRFKISLKGITKEKRLSIFNGCWKVIINTRVMGVVGRIVLGGSGVVRTLSCAGFACVVTVVG